MHREADLPCIAQRTMYKSVLSGKAFVKKRPKDTISLLEIDPKNYSETQQKHYLQHESSLNRYNSNKLLYDVILCCHLNDIGKH